MSLREALARASHDVGKYASMTARSLGPPPWDDRLRLAVARDLLATDGRRPVWEVWQERRVDLAAIAHELVEIDARVDALRAREAELRAPGAPGVDEALVADVLALARGLRDLQARARSW